MCPKIKFVQVVILIFFTDFFACTSLYIFSENSAWEKLLDSFENVVWIAILF